MARPKVDSTLATWAYKLLRGSVLPEAKRVERVWLVEPSCICFVARTISMRRKAYTALLKPSGENGTTIWKIVEGWSIGDVDAQSQAHAVPAT